MMTDYQIQSSTRRCAVSGRELQPGEKYYTVLIDQGDRFVRQDYSVEAWPGPPAEAFGFWMTRVPVPESRRRPAIDDEMLMECFQRLEGQEEAGRLRFRYVLALLLMRRRRFRFEEAQVEQGREILRLRCIRTGAQFRVVNPRMTEAETKVVQEEVFQALGWE